MRPVISLTTDFGLQDHFVGTMKGVIADICPDANVIDVTHEIPPFDILAGALAIWPAWRYFPAGTVHVVVVDPGVGSARRPILARIAGHYFIAPDNGLLTLLLEDVDRTGPVPNLHELTTPAYRLGTESFTFHGRDIFAPAAAHLAKQLSSGTPDLNGFGPRIDNVIRLDVSKPHSHGDGSVHGAILKIDRFGNLLTNLRPSDAKNLRDGNFELQIGRHKITRLHNNYLAGKEGEPFVILGSSGMLEIALNRAHAAKHHDAAPGDKFTLRTQS